MLKTLRTYRSMRAGFALIIVAFFCFAKGASGLLFRLTHWSPSQMSCAEYAATKSKPSWVDLSDCRIDVQSGSLTGRSNGDESMMLLTTAPEGKVVAVMVSSDPEHAHAVQLFGRRPGVAPAKLEEVPFRTATSIDGMVLNEFELDDAQHRAYARLSGGRGELPILVSGQGPAFFGSIGYLLGAAAAVALLILGLAASGDDTPIRVSEKRRG